MNSNVKRMILTALFLAVVILFGMTPIGMIPLPFIKVTLLCVPVIIGTLLLGLKTGMILGFAFGAVSALSAFGLSPLNPPSVTSTLLVQASPVLTLVMCFVPRLLVPLAAHGTYKLASRLQNNPSLFMPIAGAGGAIVSALFFLIVWRLVALNKARVETALPLAAMMGAVVTAALFIFAGTLIARGKQRMDIGLPIASAVGSLCNTVLYLGLMLLFYIILGINDAETGTNFSTIVAVIAGTGMIAGSCEAIAAAVIVPPVVLAIRKATKR